MKQDIRPWSLLFTIIFSVFQVYSPAQTTQQPEQQATQQQEQQARTPAAPKPLPDDLNIGDLYNYMVEKSSTYQDYRVIRQGWVNRFRTKLNDSLQVLRGSIIDNHKVIAGKSNQIDSLVRLLENTNSELSAVLKDKNSLRLLGILMNKKAYDAVMWTIVGSLIILAGFLFLLFKRSYTVTRQTKKDLQELKDEFEDFRKKALRSKEEAVKMIYDELKKYKK
jgi:hypothetical protein